MDQTHPANHGHGPVAVLPLNGAAAATIVWRRQGKLFVTVVVKGMFTIVPDGMMTPAAPEPVSRAERPNASGSGLLAAEELAPYLAQADICLIGHETVPAGRTSAGVRLGVFRDKAVLVDARAEIAAQPSNRAGAARADLGEAMGPISKNWPARRRLLGGLDPRRLEGDIIDIPDPFDWSYFQAAPAGLRTEMLRGDEWIGIFDPRSEVRPLRAHLPGARGAARLYVRALELEPKPARPIRLAADSLLIDVDRMVCSMVWRGHFAAASEAELADMFVVAGVELPGRTLTWTNPFTMNLPARRPSEPPSAAVTETLSLDDRRLGPARPATPFEHAKAPPPIRPASPPPAWRPLTSAEPPSGSPESPFGETMDLSNIMQEVLRRTAAVKHAGAAPPDLPFSPGPMTEKRSSSAPPPPSSNVQAAHDRHAGETADLSGLFGHWPGKPATPFERVEPPPEAHGFIEQPAQLTQSAPVYAPVTPSPPAPARPPEEMKPPRLDGASPAPELEAEMSLGAVFLAAIADAGAEGVNA